MTGTQAAEAQASGEFVQSFARGLRVIRAFDGADELSLSDVARRVELPRAAVRRFLHTLEALGYVRSDGRVFALTPRILELGYGYLNARSLPELVQPHLERLSREVGESTSVAVLDGDDIVYIARVAVRRIMSVGITIGTRLPAVTTSMGRVLLAALPAEEREARLECASLPSHTARTLTDATALAAELDRVAEQGFALVDGELESGLRSIAVPLHGRGGVTAALNVSSSARSDGAATFREAVLPALRATATAIDAELRLTTDA